MHTNTFNTQLVIEFSQITTMSALFDRCAAQVVKYQAEGFNCNHYTIGMGSLVGIPSVVVTFNLWHEIKSTPIGLTHEQVNRPLTPVCSAKPAGSK